MEDDWCHVSDDEEFGFHESDILFTEIEPEPELETIEVAANPSPERITAAAASDDDDFGISLNDIDIGPLLQDKFSESSQSSPPRTVSRDFSLSLLSPEHRDRRPFKKSRGKYIEANSSSAGDDGAASLSRKRTVKLAFCEPRLPSFPARLRAEMPSRRLHLDDERESPSFTPLTVFTQDQATQVCFDEVHDNDAVGDRDSRLCSALKRSMDATNQLKVKSQDLECMSLKLMNADALLDSNEYRHQRDLFKLRRLESGLVLARNREKPNLEHQDQLKAEIEQLKNENSELQHANAMLNGDSNVLETQSLDELEQLELSLSKAMDNVRAAIRANYKAAIAQKHEDTLCVVCFAKPVSVVLLPCRHQVLCSGCALRGTTCPIDRTDIQDKVLTFGLNAYKD
ncbi:Ring finger protein b, partial [Globisporangium splendens]